MYKKKFSILAFFLILHAQGDTAFLETIRINNAPFSEAKQVSSDASANLILKLDEVQQQLSAIFGQLEILENHYIQLQRKIDTIAFKESPAQVITPPAKKDESKNKDSDINLPPDAEVSSHGIPDSQDAVVSIDIKHASPEEAYQKARAFITQKKYALAEEALKKFIEDYPNHELVSPALYWMGETYFVRKDFSAAAKMFAEGYQKHSDHPKAPDHLLKLGMSLGNMDKKKDACVTYRKLVSAYPKANATILSLVQREVQKLQCQY